MSIEIEQFHGVFFDESEEHLDDMEQLLMSFEVESPDAEDLNSIFRAAHSIKGGSGIFGFDELTRLTHVMENLLDKARNQELLLTTDSVNLLLESIDVLKETLNAYREGTPTPTASIDERIAQLEQNMGLQSSNTNEDAVDEGFGFFDDEPQRVSSITDDDGFGFFDDEPIAPSVLAEREKKSSKKSASDEEEIDGFGFFEPFNFSDAEPSVPEDKQPNSSVSVSKASVESTPEQKATPVKTTPSKSAPAQTVKANGAKPKAKDSVSIRVDTNKIDAMVNLVGELVITQSMLSMIGNEVEGAVAERLQLAIDELQRNTREIQESVMSMRMLPLTSTFNRFPRLVRDLAAKLNKKVDLVINGGSTEIDKSLIEKIVDPLTHLVRNSIDHGVELPEARVAAGKPETGTIILSAEQKGGNIIIGIIDDGAGLNRQRILDKARSNGLDVNDNMPDDQVWQLIFQAGFSTAEAVTDVSGRGVGMDVVRRNIESIGGRIEIESTQGEGSGFFIHLPLTLAIVDGMCVSVGNQIFVIPLLNIIESFQPTASQVKTLGNDSVLHIRDQYWPLVPLYDYMDVENAQRSPTEGIVVLLESSKKRYGVLVDALVGQQQVVIKSLEQHYRKVAGIAGATIMGDGKVALIIDTDSIATTYTSRQIEELLS